MTTHEARALYSDLLDGELPPDELSRWLEQLDDDPALAADYAGFAASVGALRGMRPAALSEARVAAILAPLEGEPPRAPVARWPRAVAALLSAAAIWWLFAFGGWGFLLERDAPTLTRAPVVVDVPRHAPAPARDTAGDDTDPRAPRGPLPLELAPPGAGPRLAQPDADADAPRVQLAVAEPDALDASPALLPFDDGARRPRLRGSADLRLVRDEDSTRLRLRGELGAVIPELLTLLDDADPELAQLAAARLALLQDDLVARRLLPAELGVRPLRAGDAAQQERGGWFTREPAPPSPSDAWHAWWDAARAHLPAVHDSEVL